MTKLFSDIDTKNILRSALEGSYIKAAGKDENGEEIFKIVISTNQTDRYGEIVEQEGIDTTNYLKNPIVLWGHDYYLPPIGKTLKLIQQKRKTTAYFVFAPTAFAQEIKSLVKGGFVNMSSIGFISTDFDRDNGVHRTSELLEYSLVDVPANPGAEMQRTLFAKGIKELECKEVEEYICKRGDSGCKIYSKVMEELKRLRELREEEEEEEEEPETNDLSNENEEDNKDITKIETDAVGENIEEEKTFYKSVDIDTSFLGETEEDTEEIEKKIKGEVEIEEAEEKYLDLICAMGLLLKKRNDIIEEINDEKSKVEKTRKEQIHQLDEKIKDILQGNKANEEEEEVTKNLIKISSKALNLALSKINNKQVNKK